MFWRGETVGFAIMASVPHSQTVYPLLGRPQDFLNAYSSRCVWATLPGTATRETNPSSLTATTSRFPNTTVQLLMLLPPISLTLSKVLT